MFPLCVSFRVVRVLNQEVQHGFGDHTLGDAARSTRRHVRGAHLGRFRVLVRRTRGMSSSGTITSCFSSGAAASGTSHIRGTGIGAGAKVGIGWRPTSSTGTAAATAPRLQAEDVLVRRLVGAAGGQDASSLYPETIQSSDCCATPGVR